MPHILHINLSSAFGGGERQTANLIAYLSRETDLRQTLITRPGNPLAELGREAGCTVLSAKNQLQQHFHPACRGVDLVHCHDGRSVYWGLLHRWLRGTPYLITRRVEHPLKARMLTRATYRSATAVICLSRAIQAQVAKIAPAQQLPIIPSACFPVPADANRVVELKQRFAGKTLIGQIGALIDLKGQRYTLEVAKQLEASHPDVHFLFLGDGPNRSSLEAQATELRNVTFEGQVGNVGDYLACFDLLLMPSLMEGFGSTILEAMYHRVPVVASQVGGIPDIIDSGKNGLLVAPADVDALHRAVVKLLNDTALCASIGAAGGDRVGQFLPDQVFSRCWELYRAVLEQ